MKMQHSLYAAVFLLFTTVLADRTVVVLLNNGIADSTSGSCTEAEFGKVDAIVKTSGLNSTYGKRQLRATIDVEDTTEFLLSSRSEKHRSLNSNKCKSACRGWATGYCAEINCKAYRRRQLGEEQDDRGLLSGAAFTCDQQVSFIKKELSRLVTQNMVSTSCMTLLSKPTNITCYDDVIYGVVESFRLWDTNARPQAVINSNYMGQDIPRGQEINFEAITNDCVDFLLTSLKGPKNFYVDNGEYVRPFSVFGDSVSKGGKYYGKTLPYIGQYELTALPDGLLEKKMVMTFNVVPGTVNAVKLWDTASNKVLNANFTGGTVCNSKTVNFEAIMPLAGTSKITLTSTNGFSKSNTDSGMPFTVMGADDGDLSGRKLTNGAYTLTIYPDEVVSNKVMTIQFNVLSC